jgi:hypothetical protein
MSDTNPPAEQPMNVRVTITANGTEATSKAFKDSLYAKSTVRLDADELRAALERGSLEIVVEVAPLQIGEFL